MHPLASIRQNIIEEVVPLNDRGDKCHERAFSAKITLPQFRLSSRQERLPHRCQTLAPLFGFS
jgi:hypothetical protein